MRSLLVALLLVAACGGTPGRFATSSYRSPLNEELEMPRADEAIAAARAGWEEVLGPVPGDSPRVRWFRGDPLSFKGQTIKVHAIYRAGSPGEIQIGLLPGDGPRARGLLAHEMGHWARHQLQGDGDGAHADAPFWEGERAVNARIDQAIK